MNTLKRIVLATTTAVCAMFVVSQAHAADNCVQLYRAENLNIAQAIKDCQTNGGTYSACKESPDVVQMADDAASDYYACERYGIEEGHEAPTLPEEDNGVDMVCYYNDDYDVDCVISSLTIPNSKFLWMQGNGEVETAVRAEIANERTA